MAKVCFYSSVSPSLRVGFGLLIEKTLPTPQHPNGQEITYPPCKFRDGWLKLSEKENEKTIGLLRRHPGNIANGGNDFEEQHESVINAVYANMARDLSVPEEISEEVLLLIDYIHKKSESFSPNETRRLYESILELRDELTIVGIEIPVEKPKMKQLKVCVLQVSMLLEEKGLTQRG